MTLQAGKMYRPSDIAFDIANDTVYVAEKFNHRISKWNYTPGFFDFILDAGQVTSITINNGGTGYSLTDPVNIGPPTLDIANPVQATAEVDGVTGDVINSILITEAGNGYDDNNLPTVDAPTAGTPADLTAVVNPPWGNNRDGTTGEGAPVTSTTDNALYRPSGIVFDSTANPDLLYVTDTFHNRVRMIRADTGAFTTSVGSGGFGDSNFYRPIGIAIDAADAVVVIADELNRRGVRYTTGGGTLTFSLVLPDPSTGADLSFVRPHGVVFDETALEFNIGDSLRSVISSYNVAGAFQNQYGTPGVTGRVPAANDLELFFPGSGHGLASGPNTIFADTRNNNLKTMNNETIDITTGTVPGTGDGDLYYPESASAFSDGTSYILAANTLNNRVEVYNILSTPLDFQSNFGSPE